MWFLHSGLVGTLVSPRFALSLLSILLYLYCLCSALSLIETTLWGLKLSGLAYVQISLWPKTQREVPWGVRQPSPQLPTFWFPSPHISVTLVALNSDPCPTCITLYYSSRNYPPDKKQTNMEFARRSRLLLSLKDYNLGLPIIQPLKEVVSYSFSSFIDVCGGKASLVLLCYHG